MIVFIAFSCYMAAWASLLVSTQRRQKSHLVFRAALPISIVAHAVVWLLSIRSSEGIQLGFFQVSSLLFLVMNIIVALSAIRLPLTNLFLALLPLSAVSLLFAVWMPTSNVLAANLSIGMIAHVMLSIIAYSLLTIATLQAILLNYQNSQLKSHHVRSVLGIFPPLQTMETLLFDLVWAGFILLTLSIGTGIVFIDNLFEQQLSHKFLFSLASWALYAILLFGRHILGWRGRAAIRWVIAGFTMLMLAYFGSKFVLEFIIGQ